jgi:MFS family permease
MCSLWGTRPGDVEKQVPVTLLGSASTVSPVIADLAKLAVVVVVIGFGLTGLFAGSWLERHRAGSDDPQERLRRYNRARFGLTMVTLLIAYYVPALVVARFQPDGSWHAVVEYVRGHTFDGFGMAAFVAITWAHLSDPGLSADQQQDRSATVAALVAATLAAVSTFSAGGPVLWVALAAAAVGFSMFWFWYLLFSVINPSEADTRTE